ncbi:hypothetical protein DPMN_140794 [Dreissena polymorpha]|uniref:Uncharacterized protein n=1 Tax=Dreissena polymorpha TaxID=45954 RepID=A0A9D4G8A0_DREPO|nr:hypothetical protein DPMN_140794 [Dreissena polymorpha]
MFKQNFGWAWSMWAGRPRIDRIVISDVQYQFEVNRCRNVEVNFQGSSAYRRTDGRTDGGDNHIIPRSNSERRRVSPRCKDVILKGNFGWTRTMLRDRVVIRDVQY